MAHAVLILVTGVRTVCWEPCRVGRLAPSLTGLAARGLGAAELHCLLPGPGRPAGLPAAPSPDAPARPLADAQLPRLPSMFLASRAIIRPSERLFWEQV